MDFNGRDRARPCAFRVGQRSGVWCVWKDGAFYGDYLSQAQAVESARNGARAVEAKGGAAEVAVGTNVVGHPPISTARDNRVLKKSMS